MQHCAEFGPLAGETQCGALQFTHKGINVIHILSAELGNAHANIGLILH